MLHLKIDYKFSRNASNKEHLSNPLFDVLSTVHRTGSISEAARNLDLSYRHIWGELKKWEVSLGNDLIVWGRGRHAKLSPFGEKLLFAEQRAKARVQPQFESLVAEMEKEFALAFDPGAHVISIQASHDLALPRLKDFLAQEANLFLDLQFRNSTECIAALTRGECTLAGLHISEDRAQGTLMQKTFKKLLKPGKHKLINFLGRQQGLMVLPDNPKKIEHLHDLTRPEIKFVNREATSNTRLEFEQLLGRENISSKAINGFEFTETTHLSVAAAVKSGQADAGFGIHAAAKQFGLHFIPLLREQYYFVCLKDTLETPPIVKLRNLLRTPDWQSVIDGLPGYDTTSAGDVISLSQAMPWYSFRRKKNIPTSSTIT
jgi:putative molybdopterin biosynthesis protein